MLFLVNNLVVCHVANSVCGCTIALRCVAISGVALDSEGKAFVIQHKNRKPTT